MIQLSQETEKQIEALMASGNYHNQDELVQAALKTLHEHQEASKPKAKRRSSFGCMKGTGEIIGDIMQPILVEDWGGDDNE
jgi:Arc/MetJ-type ribon-helix-helix transcriptional regulator